MFRKNYLPKVQIYQDYESRKWFAGETGGDSFKDFAQTEDGEYVMSIWRGAARFDTLDDLVEALYYYAMKQHLHKIKQELTYNTVKIKV